MPFDLVGALIRTHALRVAPPGELFWYTSGTVGPYYINTHYLCGGRPEAEGLLDFIEREKEHRREFPGRLRERMARRYEADSAYRGVVDLLVSRVREEVGGAFDGVSGGERRDWFFSAVAADLLGKPHLLVYKDQSCLWFEGGRVEQEPDLSGRKLVHVADLVTEASSYLETWIPALRGRGGEMVYSANVVDRGQGGLDRIREAGVEAGALLRVDEDLFAALHQAGYIDADQRELLAAYYRDPHQAMKSFLERNPGFLHRSLESPDERTAARARRLVKENPYGLDPGILTGRVRR